MEKRIQHLIESPSGPNNALAIELLMSVEHYTLEQAIQMLQFNRMTDEIISIDIANIRLQYIFDYQPILYVPMSYADIFRTVRIDDVPIEKYTAKLHADEDVILKLGEELDPVQCETIQNDRLQMISVLSSLYKESNV